MDTSVQPCLGLPTLLCLPAQLLLLLDNLTPGLRGFLLQTPNCPLCQVYLLKISYRREGLEGIREVEEGRQGPGRGQTIDEAISPYTLVSRAFSFSATFLQILVT